MGRVRSKIPLIQDIYEALGMLPMSPLNQLLLGKETGPPVVMDQEGQFMSRTVANASLKKAAVMLKTSVYIIKKILWMVEKQGVDAV